ncbi:MAG: hypothetical protein IBX53_15060, partial [Halomonas sp.]|uniref:SWIM zinc finger family protein n=1 Tax=Halomonas sp. TaxID=1486246 RepID=UPI001A028B5C
MFDTHPIAPALMLYHALQDIQWQRSFDAGSLSRGLAYARQGRVRKGMRLEHEGAMLVLRAQVDGSGRSRYLTRLAVNPDNPGMGVVSDCSCPVGRQCKYAVAVTQSFIDDVEADGIPHRDETSLLEQRWESWLAELESPPEGKRYAETLEDDYRLALFLEIDANPRSPTLQVSPVWVRPTKRRAQGNGWVKPRPIMVRHGGGFTPRSPQALSLDQEEALELLMLGEQRRQFSSVGYEQLWSPIIHAFQARALWSLLESDTPPLLFYPKQTGAMLDLGPACRLTLAWEPDAGGNQHLRADTDPADVVSDEAVIVRAGAELCYLDERRGRFGRLEGDPELLVRLRRAPPLPPAMSGWLTERLQQAPGLSQRLPVPQAVEEHTLQGVAPRLKVTMKIATGQLSYRDGAMVPRWIEVGAALVGFDYDGIDVPPEEGESVQVFRHGQRLTVMRDPEAELALVRSLPPGMITLERLQQIEAVPAHVDLPGWALLLPLEGAPPATAAEWSTHLAGPDDWWEMIARL